MIIGGFLGDLLVRPACVQSPWWVVQSVILSLEMTKNAKKMFKLLHICKKSCNFVRFLLDAHHEYHQNTD